MPFTLIKGKFHVRNYSPDGDSIRFEPDNTAFVQALPGGRPKFNARNHVQLRLEAIDTLETHYTPPSGGGVYHQPLTLANKAMDSLLSFVGITDVEWDVLHKTVVSANDGTPGYIVTRAIEKYGRPIAFVFAGDIDKEDGASIFLTTKHLRDSYNYQALLQGYAYPTYYEGLFFDLRETLNEAVLEARDQRRELHAVDATHTGIDASSLISITQDVCIMPKLFRRLCEYMVNYGTAIGFKEKLALSKEPVLDLVNNNFTHFDTFIEQDPDSSLIKLTRFPEQLIFDPMPARPVNTFSVLMNPEIGETLAETNINGTVPGDLLRDFLA
ncbi:hypothetical protein LXM25_10205 [Dyadobacter sp. LJ53]|uniref:hypothetical protein n=1 Tax=Dyadobacter chenwenxiniae TaxID=2906456 RepID=UPI001F29CFCE|nr:hypothetical protein [Dyadobacter chenwenxiniae]MCF0050431.1 hypothetical protein [Dyadobacter chenwenxiniae]